MVYLWQIPDDYPENLIGTYDRSRSPDRFLLKQGKPLHLVADVHVRFDATASVLRQLDDLATNAMVPLVSARVVEVLVRIAARQVQLIPTKIMTLDGEMTDYSMVVATTSIQGIDHDSSQYVCVPGTSSIMKFTKLRYKQDCLGRLHIARDAEYLSNLLVSDVLRNELDSLVPSGIGLYEPEAISW
ncbi:MAG: hypothetical protein JXB13_21245 [Phycisphaerae bacterium]|nr:hypothetical protein [Phycisphaerae bacterium]